MRFTQHRRTSVVVAVVAVIVVDVAAVDVVAATSVVVAAVHSNNSNNSDLQNTVPVTQKTVFRPQSSTWKCRATLSEDLTQV